MIRPSLTFISVSLILILSGCSSVPIINDLSVKGGHESSYTHQMIDGYEEISKELRDLDKIPYRASDVIVAKLTVSAEDMNENPERRFLR